MKYGTEKLLIIILENFYNKITQIECLSSYSYYNVKYNQIMLHYYVTN